MNTTLPDSNCSALGTRSVDSFGECNCRTAFCGTFCEKYCVEDPNYYLAFLILHQILYPVFNALLILFGLIVVINFWKQGQKKRKSIAAFALYGFILCCLCKHLCFVSH
jgi:phosphotransferase system  glucose/maltose/N-acetylglucosamine-specific IIC component